MLITRLRCAATSMFSANRTPQGYAIFFLSPDRETAMHHSVTRPQQERDVPRCFCGFMGELTVFPPFLFPDPSSRV